MKTANKDYQLSELITLFISVLAWLFTGASFVALSIWLFNNHKLWI